MLSSGRSLALIEQERDLREEASFSGHNSGAVLIFMTVGPAWKCLPFTVTTAEAGTSIRMVVDRLSEWLGKCPKRGESHSQEVNKIPGMSFELWNTSVCTLLKIAGYQIVNINFQLFCGVTKTWSVIPKCHKLEMAKSFTRNSNRITKINCNPISKLNRN